MKRYLVQKKINMQEHNKKKEPRNKTKTIFKLIIFLIMLILILYLLVEMVKKFQVIRCLNDKRLCLIVCITLNPIYFFNSNK